MCLIPSDVQHNDLIAFEWCDSLTARATTGANWKVAKVVEMHKEEGNVAENEELPDVPDMTSYLIRPAVSEQ